MKEARKISIAIPTYNRFDLTVASFAQVLNDERVEEVVIVDDKSTDGSYEKLFERFKYERKVKVFQNDINLDCYANKHRAVKKCTGKWVIIFDSDNVLSKEYLDALYAIEKWDRTVCYNPQFARPCFDFRKWAGLTLTSGNVAEYVGTDLMTSLNAFNLFINRAEYLKEWDGSVNPLSSDSIFFSYTWLNAGNSIYITPGLEYDHKIHPDGSNHFTQNQHKTVDFHKNLMEKIANMKSTSKKPEPTSFDVLNKSMAYPTTKKGLKELEQRRKAADRSILSSKNTYMAYCNLDSRPDRNDKMIAELARVGLVAERRRSFPWKEMYDNSTPEWKQKVDVMFKRTPGAIGCHFSQVALMEEALKQKKHAWVNEDDLVFCDDLQERFKMIDAFLAVHDDWDIFWLGGTYHKEPHWHKLSGGRHTHPDLQMCKCTLGKDWEPTENPNIVRTFGAFSTHSYIVNKNKIKHILELLDQSVNISMGIDWIMILEQPNLKTYAFDPGCVKQYDNQSNIGAGISRFSGFGTSLGKHWFAETINGVNGSPVTVPPAVAVPIGDSAYDKVKAATEKIAKHLRTKPLHDHQILDFVKLNNNGSPVQFEYIKGQKLIRGTQGSIIYEEAL